MQVKTPQKKQIEKILLSQGEVSRNVCIRELYITRLSAIIQNLEEDGWRFKPEQVKTEFGKDFVYYLVESPYKKIIYTIPELNKTITSYVKK